MNEEKQVDERNVTNQTSIAIPNMNEVACLVAGIEGNVKEQSIAQIKETMNAMKHLASVNPAAKFAIARYLGVA